MSVGSEILDDIIADLAVEEAIVNGARKLEAKLDDMTSSVFLEYVVEKGNKEKMNHFDPKGIFKPYTFAETNFRNNTAVTAKERKLITNAFVIANTNVDLDLEDAEDKSYPGKNYVFKYKVDKAKDLYDYLESLNTYNLLKLIVEEGDKDKMNSIVPANCFEAFNIAKNLYVVGRMSKKQREALTNIYVYSKVGAMKKHIDYYDENSEMIYVAS